MKRILFAAAVFVLLGAGCGAQTQKTPSVPAETEQAAPTPAPPSAAKPPQGKPTPVAVPNPGGISPENSEDRVVVFTADAKFDPASVAVHVGRKVTWVNQSKQAMWPASNPISQCPGFDAKGPIAPGASYSFTFAKAGTCNYINHLQTGASGLVTVTPVGK